MRIPLALALAISLSCSLAAQSIEPLPIDEAAFAARLIDMAKPARGERAIIVYDPTYYAGITDRLRAELLRRGVNSYTIAEDTAAMNDQLAEDSPEHRARERDVVETLLPVFERSHLFFWMPERSYVRDLRWEFLVERSKVRSIHFHWLLPFPGGRTGEQIRREHGAMETRSLEVDLAAHAAQQQRLAAAMRGKTLQITTAAGTNLVIRVPRDQWFHLGDGDASAAKARRARSIRDREMELPVGMFNFIPEASAIAGTVKVAAMSRVPSTVRDVAFQVAGGRMTGITAGAGLDDLHASIKEIGEDGNKIATVWFHTNPFYEPAFGVMLEFGSNWENGGTNRAHRASRISIGLRDARVALDGVAIMEDGRLRWDRIP